MTTKPLSIFDPAMCCPTGVCGSSIDPELIRFGADIDWLKSCGVSVERFNLSQQPAAFAGDDAVKAALKADGEAALPIVKVDGVVMSCGVYPSRRQLAEWVGLGTPASLYTEAVAELVAIGAAIASNCEPCLKFHSDRARELGVSPEDMMRAATTAQAVKDEPAKRMRHLAEVCLRRDGARAVAATTSKSPPRESTCC